MLDWRVSPSQIPRFQAETSQGELGMNKWAEKTGTESGRPFEGARSDINSHGR
jgi:hypothetical protein